jgi:hypothetical protein
VRAYDDDFRLLNTQLLDSRVYASRIVRSGNAIVAVWAHLDAPNTTTLIAQRLDGSGEPTGLPAQLATLNTQFVSLASSDGLFAYGALGTVHVFTVQPSGALGPLTTFDARNVASITKTDDGGFIASEAAQGGAPTTFHRFDSSGNVVDRLSLGSFDQPSLTTEHGFTLAVGFGPAPVSYQYGARESKTISEIATVQTSPRLASDGTNVLMVWHEFPYTLLAQLFKPSGEALHDPIKLGLVPADVSVSFDGTSFVVARPRLSGDGSEVVVQRVARDGSHADDEFVLGTSTGKITNVVVARNMVAWLDDARFPQPRTVWTTLEQRTPIEASTAYDIAMATDGSRVLLASIVQGNTIEVSMDGTFVSAVRGQYTSGPMAVAGNGDGWLLVFSDGNDLLAQFLERDGTAKGEPLFITRAEELKSPRVAWDGSDYIVTWEDYHTVAMASVSPRGVDHAFFPGQRPAANGDAVSVNGAAVLAYQHAAMDAAGTARVFLRSVSHARTRVVR